MCFILGDRGLCGHGEVTVAGNGAFQKLLALEEILFLFAQRCALLTLRPGMNEPICWASVCVCVCVYVCVFRVQ